VALNFPDSPGIGSVFTDTTSGFSWEWTGAVWKSFTPAAAQNIKNLDDVSGSFDNSTQTFNLTIGGVTYYPRAANMLQISLGGIIQEPDTDYTVDFANGTITFTTAPNVGLDFFGVVRGTAVAIDYANDGNVQNKQNYTATEGQTAFTFSAGYTSGYLNVYRNGVKLRSTDFTETSSTIFTLNTPAQENDEIEAIGYVVASIVTTQGQFQNLNISGVATAAQFVGGGIGVGIQSAGTLVGYGVTQINFIGAGNTFALNGTTVDVSISGGGGGSIGTSGITTQTIFSNPNIITEEQFLTNPNHNYGMFGPVSIANTINVGAGNTFVVV